MTVGKYVSILGRVLRSSSQTVTILTRSTRPESKIEPRINNLGADRGNSMSGLDPS